MQGLQGLAGGHDLDVKVQIKYAITKALLHAVTRTARPPVTVIGFHPNAIAKKAAAGSVIDIAVGHFNVTLRIVESLEALNRGVDSALLEGEVRRWDINKPHSSAEAQPRNSCLVAKDVRNVIRMSNNYNSKGAKAIGARSLQSLPKVE